MCGIIGYVGKKPSSEVLLEGLKRLEYRGYDSAGICVDSPEGFKIIKSTGKLKNLLAVVPPRPFGHNGIGHTRWATHGGVTEVNAHPHTDCSGKIVIVHNGIIENYEKLRELLKDKGHSLKSDTDTEVIAHLIEQCYKGDLTKAVLETLSLLKGTYGLVVMHQDHPDMLVGARNGSPLIMGVGDGEMFLASDASAIISYTKQVIYLQDGEVVTITPDSFQTMDLDENIINKDIDIIEWKAEAFEKAGYDHYMLKEIYEQSESIVRGMKGRLDRTHATGHLGGLNMTTEELLKVERVVIIAAGTSYHAGLVAAYLLESMAGIPAHAEIASELRYRNPIIEKNTLYFAISQSGETMDTLYAMRELQRKGARVLGICNVVGSTIARESDGGVYIHSGPEIAVASTKAFTSQMTAMYIFTLIMARLRNMSFEDGLEFIDEMEAVPEKLKIIFKSAPKIEAIAKKYCHTESFLFLGRGINYPVAMEGALKLKEISYIHAEGFSAAEIKHGPIALINEKTPSLFLVTDDRLHDKIISNMKEVKSRGGKIIAVAAEGDKDVYGIADDVIEVPKTVEYIYPFLMSVPLQLLAYYSALELGRDVDQPKNLAKSVTVE
ncbi:MAG: glutamine--fructose-6-phosphate transaminase (isomerizing) [Spirochaetia bacterium]|nr:glutamine--fructose-6-phosphate transaminase (isomerizing) [Spirochaetia bacterium]MBQ6673240.1 glutamine--fructose-6-phosphate transaminase (isomerizing) [Spirochaetia bacterium]